MMILAAPLWKTALPLLAVLPHALTCVGTVPVTSTSMNAVRLLLVLPTLRSVVTLHLRATMAVLLIFLNVRISLNTFLSFLYLEAQQFFVPQFSTALTKLSVAKMALASLTIPNARKSAVLFTCLIDVLMVSALVTLVNAIVKTAVLSMLLKNARMGLAVILSWTALLLVNN
jgi:hypothetical protein